MSEKKRKKDSPAHPIRLLPVTFKALGTEFARRMQATGRRPTNGVIVEDWRLAAERAMVGQTTQPALIEVVAPTKHGDWHAKLDIIMDDPTERFRKAVEAVLDCASTPGEVKGSRGMGRSRKAANQ